jgi:hypothetical protein
MSRLVSERRYAVDVVALFDKIYRSQAKKLSWDWIDDGNVDSGTANPPFQPRQCYVIVRLSEMYLKDERVLWKKFYPMVHSFLRHKPREFAEVAGPGQLKELGSANLDRLVGLAYPLTVPVVYNGNDLEILVGLYSVPAQDAAKVLLTSLGELSKLTGVAAEVALQIAGVVKTGVEGLLQIDGNALQLGARDTLRLQDEKSASAGKQGPGKIAKAGYLLAINAPSGSVDYKQLFVKKGRLYKGSNPNTATEYSDNDYMLVEIEKREHREDWRLLPEVQKHEAIFDTALTSGKPVDDIKSEVKAKWLPFTTEIEASQDLTDPDKDRVMASIGELIRTKLANLIAPAPWETRSALNTLGARPRAGFDLLEVGDVFEGRSVSQIEQLRKTAKRSPV